MLALLFLLLSSVHPIHISVTEIEFNEKTKSLEIITRIFTDDLELSVRKQINEPELDLLNPKNGKTTEELVESYLREHFKIKLDGKLQAMSYLGHEQEGFALVCYFEIENVKKFNTIEVFNDVIMETHDDQ